jgi:hypothetical protein
MANRYTNLSPSAYTPLTLEEIAMLPAMKRKQHDAVIAQQEAIRSGLAKVDPLDVHYQRALELKKGIEGKMDATAAELASQGVNPDMIGKTLGLNREIQDLVSPTGEIGRINTAKEIYAKEKEAYIKDAVDKSGIGKARAEENWAKYAKDNYTGFDSNNKISNIGAYGAPAKQDFDKDILEAKSILGHNSTALANSGYRVFQDPTTGKMMFADRKGNLTTSTNVPQVNDAIKAFNARWFEKEGEGRKWAEHAGLDLQNLQNQAKGKFGSMVSTGSEDTRGENFSIPESLNPKAEEGFGSGTIISNDSTLQSNAVDNKTYTDALTEIKRLSGSKGALSAADAAKLEDLNELRRNADSKLNQNKEYVALNMKRKKIQEEAKKLGEEFKVPRKPGMSDNDYLAEIEYNAPTFNGKSSRIKTAKLRNDLRQIDGQYTEIKNAAWKESSSTRHNYSYMPTNPKEESIWNLHNEGVYNTLRGIPSLGNVLDLTSISTPSGNRKDVNSKDVSNIQELLKNGDPKSFKINNIKTYGDSKTPEITMTFNTGKGASDYDLKGIQGEDDQYGGAEKPVTVTFRLKKFSNSFDAGSAAGYKSLSGAIADFWKDKGGRNEVTGNFQGSEVSNALIENQYANIPTKELVQRAEVDSDAREALMIRIAKNQAKKK